MRVYRGVVKDNVVVLPQNAQLEEGTEVEIRPLLQIEEAKEESPHEALKRKLQEAGLVLEFIDPSQAQLEDFEPIKVEGLAASQMIVEERR